MPSQVSRETPVLKQQFATTEAQKVAEARGETAKTAGGELRRLREYVGNMVDKALTRGIPEGAVEETEFGPIRTQGIKETLERVTNKPIHPSVAKGVAEGRIPFRKPLDLKNTPSISPLFKGIQISRL
jgi:hypothetical protein